MPRETMTAIMEAAIAAPSWANTQPWEFLVLGGEVLEKVKASMTEKAKAREKPNSDIPSPSFEGPYLERMRSTGQGLFQALGIAREDREARQDWTLGMARFFDAPNAVIVCLDASLGQWSLLDVGLALENLMLAAWHFGIGTCVEAAAAQYPEVLRGILKIPASKRIVVGVALGYPDLSKPIMKFHARREPLASLVTWHGFD